MAFCILGVKTFKSAKNNGMFEPQASLRLFRKKIFFGTKGLFGSDSSGINGIAFLRHANGY